MLLRCRTQYNSYLYDAHVCVAHASVVSTLCRSHDHAFAAATRVFIVPAHLHLMVWCFACSCAWVAGHVLVVLPDLAHDVVEGVVDVDAGFGGRFDEFAAELSCELSALC